jgi:hypothetical protein
MPKERLHLLLAQESLRLWESADGSFKLDDGEKYSFLLGSISPDILFYDLPSFQLSPLGNRLHRFEGERILALASAWIGDLELMGDRHSMIDRDLRAWILGLSSHFLADGYFHPAIVALSTRPCAPCGALRLSARDCHHWLESGLEGYWIPRIGPSDGYFGLLDRFRKEARFGGKYIGYFREFMRRAGMDAVPEPERIARCLFWQTFLLEEFARRRWSGWRPWLLGLRRGRFLGSLIVPARSDPSLETVPSTAEVEGTGNLFHHTFMARAVIYLTTRLRSLPGPS